MASSSWKKEMYQQIANSQVQQVMQQRNQDLQLAQSLIAQYQPNQPNNDDFALAQSLISQYQPQQTAPVQTVNAAPKQQQYIPSLRQEGVNKAVERRQRLSKAGNTAIKAEARKEDQKAAFLNRLSGIGDKVNETLLPEEVEALSAPQSREYVMPTAKQDNAVDYSARYSAAPQTNEKARGGKEWNKAVTDTLNQLNSREQKAINKLTAAQNADRKKQEVQTQKNLEAVPEEVVKQYAEKKGVSVEVARAEIEDSIKKASAMNTSLQAPGGANEVTQQLTQEAQANSAEQKRLAAQRQYTPYETWGLATGKAVSDVVNGPVVLAGKLFGQDWDLYSDIDRERYAQSKEQHPTASNLGTMSGMALAGYAAGGGTGGRALASEGLPTAAEAFNATQGEALLNGAGKTEALLRGLGVAGRQMASNAAKDILKTDLATDIIPTLANDIVEGKSTGEVVGNTVLNTLLNGVFNSVGDIASLVKPVKNSLGGATTKAALNEALDSALEGNTRYAFDNVDDVVRNATLQADEAAQNIENIAKQMPEIPENVPNVAKNIPENVPENVPVRPGTAAPVSPAIENEAEAMAKAMDAEEAAKAIEQPKPEAVEPETPKLLSDDEESQLMYDFDRIDETYFANRAEIRQAIENMDFSIRNTAINDVPGKNGKMQYEIVDLDNNRKIKTFASRKAAEKAQAEYAAGNVLKEKAIKALDDIRAALKNYQDAAFRSTDVEEVNTAKKAVEAARKRYERAMKEYDPSYHDAIASKDFGDRIARPYYTRNPAAENPVDDALIDDMVNDWVQTDASNPNRFVRDAQPDSTNVYRGVNDVPGAEPLQTLADGSKKGGWKTSKAYKTFERMGYGDALKEEDFAYRVFHEDEQRALAAERYKDSKNIAQDLLDRDYAEFDEADIKAIYPEMEALHNNGDRDSLRTLDRLAKKSASVERESGRILQAKQEFSNTIGAALQDAHKAQDDFILDPWRSKNKKAREGNSRIAKALADMGHKNIPTDKPVLNHDQIKSGIIAELEKEFGSIDSYFNDEDIEFLTNLAEDKSIPLWQITDEIEHKLNHGTFYPIEKEVTEKFEGNSRLAGILKSMGDKTKPETKAPLTHDEIKKGITNELKREYADMEAQFTDSDIEYLTRLVEDKSVKDWQIADEISHKLAHGTWYSLDESLPEATIKNKQVGNILDNMYKDKKSVKPREEMTIGELLTGIKNSFEADPISSAKNFTDNDYYFVAQMVQNNVPRWQIEDEILHRLEHGEWYTLDESIAQKPVKNRQVTQMLNNVLNGKQGKKEPKEMTIGELLTGIKNSFDDEAISTTKQFTDGDYYYIAQMMQNNVPRWQIEDELAHRIQYGEWYTLDESLPVKQPTNTKLQNALNSLVGEQVRVENATPSLKQITEEVRNTLSKESADFDGLFTDDDIDYLANLIHEGVTKQELTDALDMKLATGSFGISDKTLQEVNNIFKQISHYDPNSRQFVEGQAEAYRLLANEILPNATLKEKFEAWRYIAMLGNPKTMLRNYIGNQTFNVVTGISNNVAAIAEAGIDRAAKAIGGEGIQRTKAVLNPKTDSGLIKACAEDADASRYRQIIGSKYEKMSKDTLRRSKSVFNSKIAQLYEKVTDAGISDYSAVKKKYSTSLAGYMKANGMSTDIFNAEEELRNLRNLSETRLLSDAEKARVATLSNQVQELEKARDYALKQAEYATFHEDNKIASVLSKWSKTSKEEGTGIGHILLEGMVPFKKTPANVLRSGVEYSPLGAIDSIRKTGKLIYENTGVRKGNLADVYKNKAGKEVARTLASDVIDSWSKTLTGTGLTALGFYLYNKGILHSSDPDTKYQDELEGHQNYAIEINGKSYTIDWAAPTVMPLMVGAEIAKLWDSTGKGDEDFYNNIDGYVDAANRISDPLIETSMLQGVRDTLETAATYAQNTDERKNILPLLMYNTATGYATQGIPTLGGQIARTIDPTRRSTYTDKKGVAGVLDKQLKKQMNKIPGLSMLNQPYVDTYGREQQNSPFNNPVGNLAYQMVSPGYLSNINETDADKMSREAYEVSKNANTLPKWQSKFTDAEGNRVSPEDYTTASKAYGQANYEIRDALANDDWFNGLDDSQKEEIVKGINTIAEHVGNAAIDPEYSKDSKAYNAYKDGGVRGLLDYYKGETAKNTAKDLLGDSGVTTNSNAGKAVAEAVKNGNMAQAEKLAEQAKAEKAEKVKTEETKEDLSSYGLTSISPAKTYEKAQTIIPGLTTEKFATTYKKIDTDGNQGIKQDEVIAYLNSQKITSESEAKKIWSAYGNSTWKSIPKLENGKWVKKKK